MTRGALFIPWLTLKPNIIAKLSVHISMFVRLLGSPSSRFEFSYHSGKANTVPSAMDDTPSSVARSPTLPAVLSVAFTALSVTLPNRGVIVPVTPPSRKPFPADFKRACAE